MPTMLNDVEVRVLGSLIEKQVTTPEYYPLTLNSLTLACNQKNNRYPVTSFDEATVGEAVESLREKNLVYVYYGSTSRVPKYKHVMPEVLHLTHPELALMCTLMLRGPQTIGELRGSAARIYEFSGLEEAESTLNTLISREPEPLVIRLPRQAGQKEARFAHLLSGEVAIEAMPEGEQSLRSIRTSRADPDKVQKLEQEVESLRSEVAGLQKQFEDFKRQFE
ncbi:MAG: YceH family protein [Pyrinomonadaceae bacterium]